MPHIVLPDRYKIPIPTKSNFSLGLIIPANHSIHPYVISDPPSEVLSELFSPGPHESMYTLSGYHIYFDRDLQWTFRTPNKIATALLRNDMSCSLGKKFTDVLYGDAVLYSSYDYSSKSISQGDHTVPYELLEQVAKLYEIYKNY